MNRYGGWLAILLQDIDGVIHSAQFISPRTDDRGKKLLYGGQARGHFCPIGTVDNDSPLVIAEGYATAASIHMATGWPVICAYCGGNLEPVAKIFRDAYPEILIVIAADNDQFTEGNPGVREGTKAAKAVKASLAVPQFADADMADKPTDFNDLHRLSGLRIVRKQILASFPVVATPIGDFNVDVLNDPDELIKFRYLSKGEILEFVGPTGKGKSSALLQKAACFANGKPFLGISPVHSFTILILQAENNRGDITEMKNGAASSAGLSEAEKRVFFENVHMFREEEGRLGPMFCKEVLRPLLIIYKPDFVFIDPMKSFFGGDINNQEQVTSFMRSQLQPLLTRFKTACIFAHHTPKPGGKDKPAWRNGESSYAGAGSAEWADASRTVLSLVPTKIHRVFYLDAGKKAERLRWCDANGNPVDSRLIAWSKEMGVISWRDADDDEIAQVMEETQAKKNGSRTGRQAKCNHAELVALLKPTHLTSIEWRELAFEKFGLPKRSFYRMAGEAKDDGLAWKNDVTGKWEKLIPPEERELR